MEKEIKLPKNWKKTLLGEVCKLKNGFAFKSTHYKSEGVPVIRISDIKDGLIVPRNTVRVSENKTYNEYIINTEDILVAMSGATTGKFGIFKTNEIAYQNQRVGKFNILNKDLLDNNFLLHQLHSLKRQIEKAAYGGAQPNISSKKIEEMEIVLPPLSTQQNIVSKIEELFSELDNGIANLKTAHQQLKIYRQSVLKWALEGKLTNKNIKEGGLPKGWKHIQLKDIVSLSAEKHKPTKAENLFYIGLEHIEKHTGELTSTVGVEKITTIKNKFNAGDILYGKLRPNLNKCYLAKEDGVCSTDILVLKLSPECLGKYLHPIMVSTAFVNEMSENTSGVNLPRVPTKFILEYKIPLPPIEEQGKIINELESRLSVADKMEESINQSLQQAEALRQSILKKAFSGELITEVEEAVFKPKNEHFYQMQVLALIAKASKEKQISHGEMTIAKYAYLIDKLYNVPTHYQYNRLHLGPYPIAMKKAINNKEYFKITNYNIDLINEKNLFKNGNPYQDQIVSAIDDLSKIFLNYSGKERSHKTELLATVCKVIKDIKSTDLKDVRKSMMEWEIKLKTTTCKNKADKFTETETKKCLEFIVQKGWDKKLIEN
jgi:type I restriction enzyme S subunit